MPPCCDNKGGAVEQLVPIFLGGDPLMKRTSVVIALALFGLTGSAFANEANYGRNMASACGSCHGTNGKSVGGMEALAGYPKDKMVKAVQDFRSGSKPATVMHQLAKGYTDAQIEAIAAYYAAQK
jgi:cytochrome c553